MDLLLRFSYEHDEKVAAAEAAEESASEKTNEQDEFPGYADYGDLKSEFIADAEIRQLYQQMHEEPLTTQESKINEKSSKKTESSVSNEQAGTSSSLDDVLAYYQWFRSVNQHNFVSKYCVRIFQEHLPTWPYDDLETILQMHPYESELLISDRKGAAQLCSQAIRHIHLLNQEKSLLTDETGTEQCSRYDFAIESIQNHYRVLFEQVFDHNKRIDKCMEISKIEKPFYRASGVNLQHASTLRSLVFFDSLMGWKKRELEIERFD